MLNRMSTLLLQPGRPLAALLLLNGGFGVFVFLLRRIWKKYKVIFWRNQCQECLQRSKLKQTGRPTRKGTSPSTVRRQVCVQPRRSSVQEERFGTIQIKANMYVYVYVYVYTYTHTHTLLFIWKFNFTSVSHSSDQDLDIIKGISCLGFYYSDRHKGVRSEVNNLNGKRWLMPENAETAQFCMTLLQVHQWNQCLILLKPRINP